MLIKSKDITNSFEDKDLMESISNIIFKDVKDSIEECNNLRLIVKDFGTFYFRKRKASIDDNAPSVKLKKKDFSKKILDMYEVFDKDKLEFKYEKFGKENHENYLLGKITKTFKFYEKNKSKHNT